MSSKLVRDVMHRGLVACWADEPLGDVARRLCENSINAIFVLNDSGHAKGIISQTALAVAYVQGNWQNRTAREIMVQDIVTTTGDTSIDIAIEIVLSQNIHRLLVVQEDDSKNRPIGVISLSDVICEMATK